MLEFPTEPFDKTFCTSICGDGKNVLGEVCDDGNTDGIGCKADCTGPAIGYGCTGGSISTPRVCAPVCGDGIIISPETCEDSGIGAPVSGDGCSSTCILEVDPGFVCST